MSARARVVSTAARRALTQHATFLGRRVTITSQVPAAAWRDLKAVLEALGAAYVVGTSAFEFPSGADAATEVATALEVGTVMAAAHAEGYVATPADLPSELVDELAELTGSPAIQLRVLEPSAGTGRLVCRNLGG